MAQAGCWPPCAFASRPTRRQSRTSAASASCPIAKGQGLGSRLLTAVEDQLPPTTTELRLFTSQYSEGNLRLYARLGYREFKREPTPAGYALVHLRKMRRDKRRQAGLERACGG